MRESRTVKVNGEDVTLYAAPEYGGWYEDPTDGGPIGTLYAPMNVDGSFDPDEIGEIEVRYEDA